MRIGFDVDGVLASFYEAYENLFIEVAGFNNFPPLPPDGPSHWHWPELYGYTDEHMREVWKRIKNNPYFWQDLPPMPEFHDLKDWYLFPAEKHEIYFVTARPGRRTKLQTEAWFVFHGLADVTVLISDQKGVIASALSLDYYVDDKAENIQDVQILSPSTQAYLLDRRYNRHLPVKNRISSLKEFLEIVDR